MNAPLVEARHEGGVSFVAPAGPEPVVRRRVSVISLGDSVERREAFRANNRDLEFEFVDAVDGRALSDVELRESSLFAPDLPYTRGAYGIAMTTHRLWTEIAAGDEMVTIAEDDAIFRSDFHEVTETYLRTHRNVHDFLAWGYNFDSILRGTIFNDRTPVTMCFDEASLTRSVDAFQGDRGPVLMMNLLEFYGICAYTISPAGARFLLDHCFPLKPEILFSHGLGRNIANYGIDVAMNKLYGAMRSVAAFPPLAISPNVRETSTIQE